MKSNIHKKKTHEDKFERKFACWPKNEPKAWRYHKKQNIKRFRHKCKEELMFEDTQNREELFMFYVLNFSNHSFCTFDKISEAGEHVKQLLKQGISDEEIEIINGYILDARYDPETFFEELCNGSEDVKIVYGDMV